MIRDMYKAYGTDGMVVSFEDFVLYAKQAKAQINSGMETSQLIGIIKMECYLHNIKYYHRKASVAKPRWTDSILSANNYIYPTGRGYFVECYQMPLSDHIRDSIRHAVHCAVFEVKEE
jgi:hypothetical protein